jgi:NAD(P)-dependent dehydrogenase (short-subunit alcohol dehydrogenase family)
VRLVKMDLDQFSLPILTYTRSYFLTARLAAPHDREPIRRHHDGQYPPLKDGFPLAGRYGPAQAAKEALTRELSAELALDGIRVVGLTTAGDAGICRIAQTLFRISR